MPPSEDNDGRFRKKLVKRNADKLITSKPAWALFPRLPAAYELPPRGKSRKRKARGQNAPKKKSKQPKNKSKGGKEPVESASEESEGEIESDYSAEDGSSSDEAEFAPGFEHPRNWVPLSAAPPQEAADNAFARQLFRENDQPVGRAARVVVVREHASERPRRDGSQVSYRGQAGK